MKHQPAPANAHTLSRSSRSRCVQALPSRTQPNTAEQREHTNRCSLLNATERSRTEPNAGTRGIRGRLPFWSADRAPLARLTNRPQTLSQCEKTSATLTRIDQNCTPDSHDLQQNTALPPDLPPKEKNYPNKWALASRIRPYPRTANIASNPIHDLGRKTS